MKLVTLLADRKPQILQEWFDRAIASYADETARFFKRQKDQFGNPIGTTVQSVLDLTLDGLAGEQAPADLAPALGPVIKILAVQDFSPSLALRFLFELKDIVRAELEQHPDAAEMRAELPAFERGLDALALGAFELYSQWREQVFQLKLNDIKRGTSGLVKMLNKRGYLNEIEADPDTPAVCASRLQRGVDP